MSQQPKRPRAKHYNWRGAHGIVTPAIRIDAGKGFAIISYDDARRIVDEVHDLCDDHDRRQKGNRGG